MQKLNLLGLSVVTIGLFAGCGSSSSSGDAVVTGTGFYVDSAVKGVDYVCGTKSGTTDDKGTFTFEQGQDCTFSVAGIPLRTTKADELVDGEEVFEDNAEVARFLQSIDFDGNPANGIQITAETLTVLRTALAENSSAEKLPKDATLDAVVASVVNDVDGFTGSVKTPDEVAAHLSVGQTEITKKFWAGKTFYAAYNDNNVNTVEKHIINADATSSAWEQVFGQSNSGTATLSISGDIITFDKGNDDTTRLKLLSVTDTYMEIKLIDDGEIEKLYFSLEDAEAALAMAVSTELEENSRTISVANGFGAKWIDGRKMYTIANNRIYTFSFQNNKQTIEGLAYNQSYSVEKGILTVDEEGLANDNGGVYPSGSYQYYKILNINGTKITTTNDMDLVKINGQVYGDGNDEQVFFTNKIDAQTYLDGL